MIDSTNENLVDFGFHNNGTSTITVGLATNYDPSDPPSSRC